MTSKNRHKNSEKPPAPVQEDVSKKAQKSSGGGGGGAPGSRGSGGCAGALLSAVFYVALLAAAGFGGFYLQQVVEEMRQTNARHQEGALQHAQLSAKMESIGQQVESLHGAVDGLRSSLAITRGELEGAVGRMKLGEVETRRVEEALQKLQNDLLRDLSEGIHEVKEARERDFSSLEKTVEQRLAEVSQSIKASVAEFTEAQGESQSQLAELKARLDDTEDPGLIKQELSAIVEAVAEIRTTKQEADTSADSLREQIGSVREELQTRNREVASLSQELESVRTAVQEAVGSLRRSVSEAEAGVQSLKDQSETAEVGLRQASEAALEMERRVGAVAADALKRSDNLESRVRTAEENGDALSASVSEVASKVESLSAKHHAHERALAAQEQASEKARAILGRELEGLRAAVTELMSGGSQGAPNAALVEELTQKLAALEESRVTPEQLESLRGSVAGLEGQAAKMERHERAISSMQSTLDSTIKTLSSLSKAPGKKTK